MDEIGINIAAKTSGDQSIQQQIDSLRNISKASEEATEQQKLLNEATELYGDNLRKTNRYVMEGLRISRDRALQGARERIGQTEAGLKHAPYDFALKNQLEGRTAEINRLKKEYDAEMMTERERIFGGHETPPESSGMDMASMLTQAGITRGVSGMAQVGIGRAVRSGMGRMAGMSTLGKVGMGLRVGTAAYMGYKAIQWAGEGMDLNKRFYQDMLPFRAAMKDMGGDVDAMNNRMKEMSLNIGESVFSTIQLSKEWMKLGGGNVFGGAESNAMSNTIKAAIVNGIDPNLAISYTGRMARYGTYTNARGMMKPTLINDIMRASEAAGMTGMRRPEFIKQVMSVVQNVVGSAGTVNPEIANFIGNMASMGEPFRGQRGSTFINRLNAGLTREDQSGIGFLATKEMLGDNASLFDIRSQQLKGLDDPSNLQNRWSYLKHMYGGDMDLASVALARNLGMSDQIRMIYRPGGETDSLIELLEGGRAGLTAETFMNTPEMMRRAYTTANRDIDMGLLGKHRKLAIARNMAKELGIENIEKLFTTREGFAGSSVVDTLMSGRKLTEENIYDYQSKIQGAQFEDDLGWRSKMGSLAEDIVKMQMTENAFGAKVVVISDTLTKLANHFMAAESPEKPAGYMGTSKRTITSSGQTMYE